MTCSGVAQIEFGEEPSKIEDTPIKRSVAVTNESGMASKDPYTCYKKTVGEVLEIAKEVAANNSEPLVWAIESPVPTGQMSGMLAPLYWMMIAEIDRRKELVIAIDNTRLGSLILNARKKNKTQVVQKFLEQAGKWASGKRWKADVVEAYYVAYYGSRCYMAAEYRKQGKSLEWLSDKEKRIYLGGDLNTRGRPVGIVGRQREYWFDFSSTISNPRWGLDLLMKTEKKGEEENG